ncbi:MFS transporter [Corynebacterium pseudotuberculosis]|uniref:MFS transporter n=1 Tax=Corynebacterium pseudotuberculosis 258 TaxID=1168865 RepID=A0AAU8PIR0_CORPS|nr:MFS transporter [Corynebacterium pseudotuberculosis]AEQ05753.3 MFS transporter [Corynebacterium pseudotuberculosis CIP 52.97]AFB71528.1 MFS transporter [Corynebacterium pseudotuberculosis 316]AFH90030.1 MFS transporter [Corynebacterium pseudotuberculosis 31]AFK15840.1 MFS transporter [Corynebacterium pseudotuberculosis 258]AKS12540.1 Glycerol-3-phosphate transporter [Corynebacterium pseudotuberculosis]
MFAWLQAPGPAAPLPAEQADRIYPRMRLQVFMGIFLGYAGFYLIRNNISAIAPLLIDESGAIDKPAIGIIGNAVLVSYGLSKFFSAMVSDRSNARYFLPLGLALSALMNLIVAFAPWVSASVGLFATVMFLNGWFQGMGYPPCGRIVVQWFSTSERGWKGSLWNTSHNLGAFGLPILVGIGLSITGQNWRAAYWLPALVALLVAVVAFFLIRDNPQSVGLPPIDDYRNDPAKVAEDTGEKISTKDLVFKHILHNRIIMLLAIANVFVYALRYGVLHWITTYLSEQHHMSIGSGLIGFAAFELAGFIGTVLCGWLSDNMFKGNRSAAISLFTLGAGLSIAAYWLAPVGTPFWLMVIFVALIGGFIYGPVGLIGLQALDLSPRNVAGTAAGFTGLFGYLLGATLASTGVGFLVKFAGWNVTFIVFLVFTILILVIFQVIWREEKKLVHDRALQLEQGV